MKKEKLILVIAGASGVVGRHIISYAQENRWEIRILSRNQRYHGKSAISGAVTFYKWDPAGDFEKDNSDVVKALEGADFLINLAGSSITEGRLEKKIQLKVVKSRLDAIDTLIRAYKKCDHPPKVWGQASAVGFYGDSKEENVSEKSHAGNLFLSGVCEQWEDAADRITEVDPSVRLLIGRFGLVLAKDAPAWQKMIKPVQIGLGGPIGSGNQWFSWIDADDLASAFFYLFHQVDAAGIYNFTTPDPVRQKDLVIKIARFFHKPHFVKTPKFLVRLLLGKVADEVLLASCKALPEKLMKTGFRFAYSEIAREINHLLNNKSRK